MTKLQTETNTVNMGRRVKNAGFELRLGHISDLQPVFEHGQWWLRNSRTGEDWAACDAEGPGSHDGFSFELVTQRQE